MSAKIKLSYETTPELLAVIVQLGKMVEKVKHQPQKGRYRLVYIDIKPLPCSAKSDIIEQ